MQRGGEGKGSWDRLTNSMRSLAPQTLVESSVSRSSCVQYLPCYFHGVAWRYKFEIWHTKDFERFGGGQCLWEMREPSPEGHISLPTHSTLAPGLLATIPNSSAASVKERS